MFRITKKTMALVAVCALVFAACSKNESAGGNAASAQSTGSQQKSAAATSKSGGGKSTKIPQPKLAEAKDFDYELTSDGKGIRITKYKGASVSVIVPSEIEGFPVTEMDKDTFDDYTDKLVNVVLPASVKQLESGMFNGKRVYKNVNGEQKEAWESYAALKSVILPADMAITKIPAYFLQGGLIESIVIPNKVVQIEQRAFEYCKNLKNIDIQSTVLEEIGEYSYVGHSDGSSFAGCTSLENVSLPDSVKVIHNATFEGCTSLKSINLPNGVLLEEWRMFSTGIFKDCSSLNELIIPEGGKIRFWEEGNYNEKSSKDCFEGCSSLSIATQARLRELGYKGSF